MGEGPLWDFYRSVEDLRARLEKDGELEWSERVLVGLRAGATSGEILGHLNGTLKELHESQAAKDLYIEGEVKRLFDFTVNALSPRPWTWNPKLQRYEPPAPDSP